MKGQGQTPEAAKGAGRPVGIPGVDEGGHLPAFSRSDPAELHTIQLAPATAPTAALMRHPAGEKSPAGNERSTHHVPTIPRDAGCVSLGGTPGGVNLNGRLVGGAGHKDRGIAEKGVDLEDT